MAIVDGGLVERMAAKVRVPDSLPVLALRQWTVDDSEKRMRRLVGVIAETLGYGRDRGDLRRGRGRTVMLLPHGARGTVYHASGAVRVSMGLASAEKMFERIPDDDALVNSVQVVAEGLRLTEWVGHGEQLSFERLWKVRGQAAGPDGTVAPPVLFRALGAYRHFVHEVPVWGPAAASISVGSDAVLDKVSIHARRGTGEVIAEPRIIPPEQAAASFLTEVGTLLGDSRERLSDIARAEPLQFGYVSLPKRKQQRVLAPAYVGRIRLEGDQVQAYTFIVAATDEPYLDAGACRAPAPIRLAARSTQQVVA